jgi:hypothetical protein
MTLAICNGWVTLHYKDGRTLYVDPTKVCAVETEDRDRPEAGCMLILVSGESEPLKESAKEVLKALTADWSTD